MIKRKFFQPILFFVLFVISLIFGLCQYGVRCKMHQVIPEAIADQTWAMSAAISNSCYGLKGYMYFKDVDQALQKGGLGWCGVSNPADYHKNLRNPEMLNKAIQSARSLDLKKTFPYLLRNAIVPIPGIDLGLVDYYKFAFKIFGYKISSPYYFFFLLLSMTVTFYILAFKKSVIYLSIIPLYLLALLMTMIHMDLSKDLNYATVFNFRSLPLLLVLPTLHIIIKFLDRKVFTYSELILIGAQSIFLNFIIFCRSSGQSFLVTIMLAFVCLFVYRLIKLKRYTFNNVHIKILLSLFVIAVFIKSQKISAIFSLFRTSLIKDYTLSLTSLLYAFLFLAGCLFGFYFFYKKYLKSEIRKHKILIFSSFFLVYTTPILVFVLKERSSNKPLSLLAGSFYKLFLMSIVVYIIINTLRVLEKKHKVTILDFLSELRFIKNSPIFILLFITLFSKIIITLNLHPYYFTDDVLSNHMKYHNAYMGVVSYDPTRLILNPSQEVHGDTFCFLKGLEIFQANLRKKGVPYNDRTHICRYTNLYKIGLHDKIMRTCYLKVLKDHPVLFFKAHINKAKSILYGWNYFLKYTIKKSFKPLIFSILLLITLSIFLSKRALKESVILAFASLCLVIGTATPFLYAYPPSHYYVTENSISYVLFCLISFVCIFILLSNSIRAMYLYTYVKIKKLSKIRNQIDF
ncbi:MAG: hypothetical protein S4CHLAM7_10400 [Chlamydiae bacterium]|nr:hypothetical protein [Chlamydiota bacterium]